MAYFWRLCALLLLLLLSALPAAAQQPPPYVIEAFVTGLDFPVAMAFAPDGRLFVTEKNTGRVRVVSAEGELQADPVIELPTDGYVERGLIGIALDPGFAENGFIWVYHTQPNTVEPPYPINKVVRFREEAGQGYDPVEMLSIPVTTRVGHHMGGNLHFDAQGYLYVAIGDYGDAAFAQDLDALPGKIHRFAVEDDQLVPAPGNPFGEERSLYAYGLRNPFDFYIDPLTGDIFAGENGPTCDDEVNLILAGGNYGWRPDYPCDDADPQSASYVYPLVYYTPPEAITGILVYNGAMFPEWAGDVFFCSWNFGTLRRAELNRQRDAFRRVNVVTLPGRSCHTDLAEGPEGAIYFTEAGGIYRLLREE